MAINSLSQQTVSVDFAIKENSIYKNVDPDLKLYNKPIKIVTEI